MTFLLWPKPNAPFDKDSGTPGRWGEVMAKDGSQAR